MPFEADIIPIPRDRSHCVREPTRTRPGSASTRRRSSRSHGSGSVTQKQVRVPGSYVTANIAGQPIVVIPGPKWSVACVLQRMQTPSSSGAQRRGQAPTDRVPVSRLAISTGWPACRRAAHKEFVTSEIRLSRVAGGVLRLRVREPRSVRPAAAATLRESGIRNPHERGRQA